MRKVISNQRNRKKNVSKFRRQKRKWERMILFLYNFFFHFSNIFYKIRFIFLNQSPSLVWIWSFYLRDFHFGTLQSRIFYEFGLFYAVSDYAVYRRTYLPRESEDEYIMYMPITIAEILCPVKKQEAREVTMIEWQRLGTPRKMADGRIDLSRM